MENIEKHATSDVAKLLIANKVDLRGNAADAAERGMITKEEGEAVAGRCEIEYLETSAKTGTNVKNGEWFFFRGGGGWGECGRLQLLCLFVYYLFGLFFDRLFCLILSCSLLFLVPFIPAFYNLAKKIISKNGGVQAAGVASPKLVKLSAGGGISAAQRKKKPCMIG